MHDQRFLLMAAAVLASAAPAHAAVNVVTTLPGLAALAKEVGGSFVDVRAMALATQDPHFVDAKPSLALALNRADLLVLAGLELEIGWLPKLLVGARNGGIQVGSRGYLDCSQFVRLLQVQRQVVDRSMGDIHPAGNPHYLYDPRAAAACARGIADRLAELDPKNARAYGDQYAAFAKRLEDRRKDWEAKMAPHRGGPLIGYHMTWVYLADWLGLEEVGFLEPKPGIPPNPTHVARLLGLARARKVRVILQEQHFPDATSRVLASKVPASLVEIVADVDFQGGQTYAAFMDGLVDRLARGFADAGKAGGG